MNPNQLAVYLTQNAHKAKYVKVEVVSIPASQIILAVIRQFALLKIIELLAPVLLVLREIHTDNAQKVRTIL